jgi:hypothetical protein
MATRKLEQSEWQRFFDRVSKIIMGQRAEIEVAAMPLGDQIEAEWLPLIGIVYDRKSDAIEVLLEGVDHLIRSPREVYVDEEAGGISSLLAVDGDGVRHIMKLRDALMLPAAADAH